MSNLIVDEHKTYNRAFNPKRVICPNTHKILIGKKYRGKTVEEVIPFDLKYIGWLRSKPWAQNDSKLMELIKDVAVPDLTFGKHKGKTLEWVMANDEDYMKFLYNSDHIKERHQELWAKVCKIYI